MKRGFTLIELLAVLVVISVLSLITVPIANNVISNSKRKSMLESVNGLVTSARYFAIDNIGVYEFNFSDTKNGETDNGVKLDYDGILNANGKLYVDSEGDISLCVMNDEYYVYKNYNADVIIGDRTEEDYCVIGLDESKNKYIAKKYDGKGFNTDYSKATIDEKIDELKSLNDLNTIKISDIYLSATNINLDNYVLQSDLDNINERISETTNIIKSNSSRLSGLEKKET